MNADTIQKENTAKCVWTATTKGGGDTPNPLTLPSASGVLVTLIRRNVIMISKQRNRYNIDVINSFRLD